MKNLYSLLADFKKRLNFQVNLFNIAEFVILATIFPIVMYANPQLFVEDGWVENLQLIILIACFYPALGAKQDKPLFNLAAMIILLMIARELNMGRYYVCDYLGMSRSDCSWKNIPHGYIANIIRAGFALYVIFYAFKTKIHNFVIKYLQTAPIYVWDICFVAVGAVLATLAEKPIDNEILEETAETLLYFAMFGIIWRYKNNLQNTKS
ncbi:MAG: hypothetical protein IKN67_04660 [Alphaproteobacteria bacterium]|nr:hypothetical protein [Alphaproteobacteria bacterium]